MSTFSRPFCANCQEFMRVARNDVLVMSTYKHPLRESEGTESLIPYEEARGDRWECEECNCSVIVGFGKPNLCGGNESERLGRLKEVTMGAPVDSAEPQEQLSPRGISFELYIEGVWDDGQKET